MPQAARLRWGTKPGIENSCLVYSTNLVGSSGRDSLRKSGTPAEHSLRVYTITENITGPIEEHPFSIGRLKQQRILHPLSIGGVVKPDWHQSR